MSCLLRTAPFGIRPPGRVLLSVPGKRPAFTPIGHIGLTNFPLHVAGSMRGCCIGSRVCRRAGGGSGYHISLHGKSLLFQNRRPLNRAGSYIAGLSKAVLSLNGKGRLLYFVWATPPCGACAIPDRRSDSAGAQRGALPCRHSRTGPRWWLCPVRCRL